MQIQHGFTSTNTNAFAVARMIWTQQGLPGFFKGCVPPLWGSMVYRAAMMSTFEASYTYFEQNYEKDSWYRTDLGFGLRPIIPISGFLAAFTRGFVESPIEYAKVMGQTNQKWQLRDIYRGLPFQVIRTTALVTPIFTMVDCFRQKTNILKTLWGNFAVVSGCAGVAYMAVWPLETLKNLAQTGTPTPNATVAERIAYMGGVRGLFRGIWPGTLSGGIRLVGTKIC